MAVQDQNSYEDKALNDQIDLYLNLENCLQSVGNLELNWIENLKD